MATEPNMRQELIDLLNGNYPEVAKGHYVILRRLDRDDNGDPVPCSCVDALGEVDKDSFCPVCWGIGFTWVEEWLLTYSVYASPNDTANTYLNKILPPGIFTVPAMIFYAVYDEAIKQDDRIIEVSLDVAGNVVEPLKRVEAYKVVYPYAYRADNGKLEYYKLFAHAEKLKFLNVPTYGGSG